MNITEKRRAQLLRLRNERFDGVTARLAHALERAPGYVSRVLREKKGIAESFCRDVEKRLELPHLWMDGLAENETPPEISRAVIDADVLHRCLTAVDAYVAAHPSRSASGRERTELAALLYGMFIDEDATDEQMRAFLEKWTAITKKKGVRDKRHEPVKIWVDPHQK